MNPTCTCSCKLLFVLSYMYVLQNVCTIRACALISPSTVFACALCMVLVGIYGSTPTYMYMYSVSKHVVKSTLWNDAGSYGEGHIMGECAHNSVW